MKVTVLGSGTSVPSLQRASPSYLIETAARQFLVDCGSGTLRQLLRAGKDYRQIDGLFITHGHPDHIGDMIPLLHALVNTPGFVRKKPFLIVAPSKVLQFYNECVKSFFNLKELKVETLLPGDRFVVEEFLVYSRKTIHSEDSIAYRFELGQRSVVFTGDADFSEELVSFCTGADLLIADCSFPDEMKKEGHMVPRQCGLLASRAGVKTLVLSHIYPTGTAENRLLSQCAAVFRGHIIVAADLMEIEPI